MPIRLIRETDVQSLVTMTDALRAVEDSLREQGLGSGVNEPRRRVRQPAGTLQLMGGALLARGYWGFKAYSVTRRGAHFTVNLYHAESGALLSIVEANLLGQLRTGAASGVATRHLARPDVQVFALFGSGFQAEAQLEAVAAVRPLAEVRVYSRDAAKRAAFAERMAARLSLNVHPAASAREALAGADIVTTITTSAEPVFDGNDLAPGTHVNAAGSNASIRAEIDTTTVRRADRIFVDDVEQARIESGDLIRALERSGFNWSRARPLADVVAGLTIGRADPREITLFESHGIALWDIALAADIYERAQAQDKGDVIAFAD